jgi:hypothetical protein
LSEEDDCSTSSSGVDDIDNEYDEQELLVEFRKLIRKHMKLQKRHGNLLCSHNELINSYALLESAHEVMVTNLNLTLAHVHHLLLIYLVLTLIALKQSHHVMSMYL